MSQHSNSATRSRRVAALARVALAVVFVFFGALKFAPHSMYIRIFAQIGIGDWFRYFAGTTEIVGAALLLIHGTVLAGVFLLCCTMLGAVSFWLLNGNITAACVPGVLLATTACVGLAYRTKG